MSSIVDHAVFILAACLLWAGSFRVASWCGLAGLERIAGSAVLLAAVAILQALLLGIISIANSSVAVVFLSGAFFFVARAVDQSITPAALNEFSSFWTSAHPVKRVATGVVGGAAVAGLLSTFHWGEMGWDNVVYHYPEVINWVYNGQPGSIVKLSYDFPYADYTLNNEVLMAWGAALAGSFAPLFLVSVLSPAVLGLGIVVLLRSLRVTRVLIALGVLAILVQTWVAVQISWSMGDVIATGWAAIAVGLSIGSSWSVRRQGLAFVAAGLAVGTKTVVLVPLTAALLLAISVRRDELKASWRALVPWLAPSLLLGGFWLARTTVRHGSPFWPLQEVPWGDPMPAVFRMISERFVDRPWATLSENPKQLVAFAGGGLILVVAGVLSPLIRRTRIVLAASSVCALAFASWCFVSGTGLPVAKVLFSPLGFVLSETRYLEPAYVAGLTAIALAGTGSRSRMIAACSVLSLSIAIGLVGSGGLLPQTGVLTGNPLAAHPIETSVVLFVCVLIAVLASPSLVARSSRYRRGHSHLVAKIAACGVLVSLGAIGLASGSAGIIERRASASAPKALPDWNPNSPALLERVKQISLWRFAGGLPGERELLRAFSGYPEWREGDAPIAFASRAVVAGLTGDRLQHNLVLIGSNEDCPTALRRTQIGWVVTAPPSYLDRFMGVTDYPVFRCFSKMKPILMGAFNVYREPPTKSR